MSDALAFLILFALAVVASFFAGYCRGNRSGELTGFRRGVARASRLRGGALKLKPEVNVPREPSLPEIPSDYNLR